jgi:hypothetical protein
LKVDFRRSTATPGCMLSSSLAAWVHFAYPQPRYFRFLHDAGRMPGTMLAVSS